jgi:hypothetical protein
MLKLVPLGKAVWLTWWLTWRLPLLNSSRLFGWRRRIWLRLYTYLQLWSIWKMWLDWVGGKLLKRQNCNKTMTKFLTWHTLKFVESKLTIMQMNYLHRDITNWVGICWGRWPWDWIAWQLLYNVLNIISAVALTHILASVGVRTRVWLTKRIDCWWW